MWRVRRFLTACLITRGAAATDGGCRLVVAATVWRVAGRFPLVGRSAVCLCSLALVARVLFAACAMERFAAFDDVYSRVACVSIGIVARAARWRNLPLTVGVLSSTRLLSVCLFCLFVECSVLSVRVRFVDGFVGVSDARLFHSRSVAYKCYWLARDVFGYGEESARVAYMAGWCHDAGYAFAPTQLDHAEAGGVILVDAGASFADAVRSHGDPDVLAMSDLLLIVNTADMMCGPDGVPVSFDERLSDVEARYGVGSRQAVDVGEMLSVLRRELELRGVSVEAAERAGVERVDEVGESAESVEGAAGADATADTGVSDAEETADSL